MSGSAANRSVMLTPPGAGAIGVIRVVGLDAPAIVGELFAPAERAAPGRVAAWKSKLAAVPTAGELRYGRFTADGETIDDVLISRGQRGDPPTVDISAHGGVRVMERILETLARFGAPLEENVDASAEIWPSSDRIEKEALLALAHAKTPRAVRFLARQRRVLGGYLKHVAALCRSNRGEAKRELAALLAGYPAALRLVKGATVVIVGPPNSGKSTLFNRLVGRPATIVSTVAGTTRDWVAESVAVDDVPMTLIDAAGTCESADALERQAVAASAAIDRRADLRILLLDGSLAPSDDAKNAHAIWGNRPDCLTVINKCDRTRAGNSKDWMAEPAIRLQELCHISALTGEGVGRMKDALLVALGFAGWRDAAPSIFTPGQRHHVSEAVADLPDRAAAARTILDRLIGASVA